jgi:hypothetical protein
MEQRRKRFKFSLFGEKRKPQIILHLMNYLIFLVAFGLLFIYAYWNLYPYVPIVVKQPIEICNENKEVRPGEHLIYKLDMDKRMPLPCTITKQLINDFIITYSPIVGNLPEGEFVKSVKIKIPKSAEPGTYRLKWEASYPVNRERNVIVTAWSEYFTILDKDEK